MTKLTVKEIEALKPDGRRREYADGSVRGLYFVVQPSGGKSWALRYRHDGRSRKLTLGGWPELGLEVARKIATERLGEAAQRRDPAREKRAAKAAARTPDDCDLVEKVAGQFIARHIRATMRPSWGREAERMVRKEIIAAWAGRRLSEIRKADIHNLLDAIIDRPAPVLANRVFAIFRKMCSWAMTRGIIETSPCAGIKPPATERSRDRILSDDELKAVRQACEWLGWPFGPLIQLLILTGQRRDEVGSMRWSELDLAGRLWQLPKERTKNSVAHPVPLSPQAVAIIEAMPRIAGVQDFVFTTNGKTAVSGFSRAKARIDAALPDVPQWILHDLRRTAASGMARLGVQLPVIEKVLNHVSGSFAGIVGVYQHHAFADEKKQALDVWARHVEALTSGKPADNVILMTRPDNLALGEK
jgi:integrase